MDAEINDSPSTLQQYLGFTTTRKRFKPDHNLFTFPVVHSAPLRTFAPKSSHAQIFLKLWLQVENDKIRLKT